MKADNKDLAKEVERVKKIMQTLGFNRNGVNSLRILHYEKVLNDFEVLKNSDMSTAKKEKEISNFYKALKNIK